MLHTSANGFTGKHVMSGRSCMAIFVIFLDVTRKTSVLHSHRVAVIEITNTTLRILLWRASERQNALCFHLKKTKHIVQDTLLTVRGDSGD
jgi:hypothetical protein